MGNNFSSKYELFRNVKADDKKGLNKNYGIFLVLRRKTGSAALPVRFTDQGFIFIHFSVHLPYLLLAAHIRRTIYAV